MGWAADNGGDGGNGVQRCAPRVEEVEDMDIMETRGIDDNKIVRENM